MLENLDMIQTWYVSFYLNRLINSLNVHQICEIIRYPPTEKNTHDVIAYEMLWKYPPMKSNTAYIAM
jgi:hypothetical protein